MFPHARAVVLLAAVCANVPVNVFGGAPRCVDCRSRGELGSCKDPFTLNPLQLESERGARSVLCASGWCGKIIESANLNNEYGTATQRLCLLKSPDDNEERCAYTVWKHKKVYMCLCNGDLCNSAVVTRVSTTLIAIIVSSLVLSFVL